MKALGIRLRRACSCWPACRDAGSDRRRTAKDWAGLIRYGSENAELRAAQSRVRIAWCFSATRSRSCGGRGSARFFPGQAVPESRNRRPDHRADAGALSSGRGGAEAEGGRDPGGHERSVGGDGRRDGGQLHVDDGYRQGERYSRGAGLGDSGLRLLHQTDGTPAAGEDHQPERLDQGFRGTAAEQCISITMPRWPTGAISRRS